ncbi:MAG: glycosyltransferase family 9 protein [Gammaproteobacteria bacterium]|nr:glycosyltransferase family 9 protein [Gammaproteobacteria bacterium]
MRLSAIGDVCHTLPVVRTIQDHWPETHLTWIIGKLEHQLVGDIPGIEFIVYDKRGGKAAKRHVVDMLGDREFEALLHMQVALRSSLLARKVRTPVRIGFDRPRARDWQWLFTNQRIAAREREHVMDSLFGFSDALGIPRPRQPRWDIPVPERNRSEAEQLLPGDQPTLLISPCSSQRARNFRNWSVARYAAVADHAARQHGVRTIITGGPTTLEREYGEAIAETVQQAEVINVVGKTSLKTLYGLLGRASVVLCPDSGPAHMANAANTPVIGLYATSNPLRTGPHDSLAWTVNRYPDALQKALGKTVDEVRWGQRVRDPDAMDVIEVSDVTANLDALSVAGFPELRPPLC